MYGKVYCACCDGLNVNTITVEVSVEDGVNFFLVGLPDSAIKESQQRIANALGTYGYRIPGRRVVVNLAPANIRKEGSGFDVPIAIGILSASGQIAPPEDFEEEEYNGQLSINQNIRSIHRISPELQNTLDKTLIVGELALDGTLRAVPGALPIINHAKREGFTGCILPLKSAAEGAEIEGITIYGAQNIRDVINILLYRDFAETKIVSPIMSDLQKERNWEYDFCQVKGQRFAKRGLEIAAAGAHNVLMIGSAGSGKTFMAKCLPSILPPMTKEESIQTSEIYSVANLLDGGLIKQRPYRAPHHTITIPALVGGGTYGRPGEISLAHNGVLFADEFAEFDRKVIDVLRQPLENGTIEISRVKNKYIYPARFMFVGAMNPCPCGRLYEENSQCTCTSSQIIRYQSKVSGPVLDRIDIFLKITSLKSEEIFESLIRREDSKEEPSAAIAQRVLKARKIQQERYKTEAFFTNSDIPPRKLLEYCRLSPKEEEFLKKVTQTLNISARGYTRLLKVARTIADLAGAQNIQTEHLSLAMQFRDIER